MRSILFDILCVAALFGALFQLYHCVEFLAEKDYMAGIITAMLGVIFIRTSSEFARYAAFGRGE